MLELLSSLDYFARITDLLRVITLTIRHKQVVYELIFRWRVLSRP